MLASEATIPATDEGLLRGDGVFEVIRVYAGRPFAFEEHLQRLERSASNLRLPLDLEAVRADAYRLLAHAGTGPDHELLRIVVTRGGRRLLLTESLPTTRRAGAAGDDHLCADAHPRRRQVAVLRREHARHRAWRASAASTRRCWSPRTAACSRRPRARSSGSRTATLLTPPLAEHILASITRRVVIDVTGRRRAGVHARGAARRPTRCSWPRPCARSSRWPRSTTARSTRDAPVTARIARAGRGADPVGARRS